jgi:hypothetical protein
VGGGGLDLDGAVVGLGDVLDDGEADADAGGLAAEFGAATVEGLENAGAVFGGDAGAVVGDGEGQGGWGGAEATGDEDVGMGGGMLDGIVDEVDEGLLDGFAVEDGFEGGDGGGRIEFEGDLAVVGVGAHEGEGVVEEGGEVGGLEGVLFAALVDAGEVEDVLDETREAAAFLTDEAVVGVAFGGVGDAVALEALGEEADGGDGGAEFMGGGRDEIGAEFVEAELTGEGAMGGEEAKTGHGGRGEDEGAEPEGSATLAGEEGGGVGEVDRDADPGGVGGVGGRVRGAGGEDGGWGRMEGAPGDFDRGCEIRLEARGLGNDALQDLADGGFGEAAAAVGIGWGAKDEPGGWGIGGGGGVRGGRWWGE